MKQMEMDGQLFLKFFFFSSLFSCLLRNDELWLLSSFYVEAKGSHVPLHVATFLQSAKYLGNVSDGGGCLMLN
jgi:hypothetical protein